jgi:hypothetical protein
LIKATAMECRGRTRVARGFMFFFFPLLFFLKSSFSQRVYPELAEVESSESSESTESMRSGFAYFNGRDHDGHQHSDNQSVCFTLSSRNVLVSTK